MRRLARSDGSYAWAATLCAWTVGPLIGCGFPAILYAECAAALRGRRSPAAGIIAFASLHAVVAGLVAIWAAAVLVSGPDRTGAVTVAIVLLVAVASLAAAVAGGVRAGRAIGAIGAIRRLAAAGLGRPLGFAPVMPAPLFDGHWDNPLRATPLRRTGWTWLAFASRPLRLPPLPDGRGSLDAATPFEEPLKAKAPGPGLPTSA